MVRIFFLLFLPVFFGLLYSTTGRADDSDERLAKAKTAFELARPELLRPVMILPIEDADGRIRDDGWLLTRMASSSLIYGRERRMNASLLWHYRILGQIMHTGITEVDEPFIALFRSVTENAIYVRAALVDEGAQYRLMLSFHEDDREPRKDQRTLSKDRYGLIPGMVARFALEQLGHELSDEERERLGRPQLQGPEDVALWMQCMALPMSRERDERILAFLERNPNCELAWDRYLRDAASARQPLQKYRELSDDQRNDRIGIAAAILTHRAGLFEDAFSRLLRFVPTHANDPFFHLTLARTAAALKDEALANWILDRWRLEGKQYSDHLFRGEFLIEWAWEARGGAFAGAVPAEAWRPFTTRLREARVELEAAVAQAPRGWEAHARLIPVAMGLGLPRSYMETHFRASVEALPNRTHAYRLKLNYLYLRWHGTPAALVEFAGECLATDAWEQGIPQLAPEAVYDALFSPQAATFPSEQAVRRQAWEVLQQYFERSEGVEGKPEHRLAVNLYVRLAVAAGQYHEAAKYVDQLLGDQAGSGTAVSYPQTMNFLHLRDVMKTKAKTGLPRDTLPAHLRVAIHEQRFDDAQRIIDEAKPNSLDESLAVQHYRRALQLARTLQEKQELRFKPEHIKYTFDVLPHRELEIDPEMGEVEGDGFLLKLPDASHVTPKKAIIFPGSFEQATISGTLEWSPGILYYELAWRVRDSDPPPALRWDARSSRLSAVHHGVPQFTVPFSRSKLDFRVQTGEEFDTIQLGNSPALRIPGKPHQPGTLMLTVAWDKKAKDRMIKISNLQIQLEPPTRNAPESPSSSQ